jgi:putative nucleotidyltransferase with HDIG domain
MQAVLEALPHEFQQFREVVESFSKLVLQSRLFPGRHPSVERALGAACMHLDAVLQGKKSVKLVFAKGIMFWLNFEFDMTGGHDQAMHLFRESLMRQSIGEIEFQSGVTKEEVAAFASLLAGIAAKQPGNVAALTERIERIRVRHGYRSEDTADADEAPAEPAGTADRRSPSGGSGVKGGGAMGKVVEEVLDKLEKIQSKDGSTARAKIIEVIEREGGATATILLLNSLREYDDYTFTHSVNVAVISAAIARNLGLGDAFVDSVAHAALLHDIGKLYVPRAVIHKAARLLPNEWQLMKRHPIDGERILREERLDLVSRRVAYEHHMRHDLTGYPAPKEGFEVHKASEIVRIADTYDALTTKRPYRRQINPYEAIKLMERGSGSEFRKDYFLAFMRVLGNIPIGSMLRLDTGETAVVIGMSAGSGELPRVRVLKDASGEDVEGEVVIDLNELDIETNRPKRRIASILDQVVRDVDIGQYIAS